MQFCSGIPDKLDGHGESPIHIRAYPFDRDAHSGSTCNSNNSFDHVFLTFTYMAANPEQDPIEVICLENHN